MKKYQNAKKIQTAVRQYYGYIALLTGLETAIGCGCGSDNLACCQPEQDQTLNFGTQGYVAGNLQALPPDVTNLSLGCGDPVTLASLQPGQTVVDLGSGGGIDCFLAAAKVGPSGTVIGIDMTSEMIARAQSNQAKLGIENVEFRRGEIEDLPVDDDSVDVIISNCVINLSTDKPKVFQEALRILKPGGKLAVSDIVTDGHLPESVISNLSAWASCLGGALDVGELIHLLESSGFINIDVQPYYWDAEVFKTAADQDRSEENQSAENKNDDEISVLQSAIFSAKITAMKPHN